MNDRVVEIGRQAFARFGITFPDVLDPEIIVAWFQQVATMSIEEVARASSEGLHSLPIETLRKLRDIKNALNVVSRISETGVMQKHRELETWLQLRPGLP